MYCLKQRTQEKLPSPPLRWLLVQSSSSTCQPHFWSKGRPTTVHSPPDCIQRRSEVQLQISQCTQNNVSYFLYFKTVCISKHSQMNSTGANKDMTDRTQVWPYSARKEISKSRWERIDHLKDTKLPFPHHSRALSSNSDYILNDTAMLTLTVLSLLNHLAPVCSLMPYSQVFINNIIYNTIKWSDMK